MQHPSPPTKTELGEDKPMLQEVKKLIKKLKNIRPKGKMQ
jgi:hypothetical protein